MKDLEHHDQRHLEAAQGWFELGNCIEATKELDSIAPEMRGHPGVLQVRFQIYSAAREWEFAAEIAKAISEILPGSPFGFIHLAFALHELKRSQEAWNVLLPVVDKFPDEYIIRYNLACYACQLGNRQEAWDWLEKAIELAGKKKVRVMALEDPDLEPLWPKISEI